MKKFLNVVILFLFSMSLLFTGYLWWRSHQQTDDLFHYGNARMTRFRSSGGGFWFETRPWAAGAPPLTEWNVFPEEAVYPFSTLPTDPWYERCGFLVNTMNYDLLLSAPYWSVLVLQLPIPLWLLWRKKRVTPSELPPLPHNS
jgi:hypothetical protein